VVIISKVIQCDYRLENGDRLTKENFHERNEVSPTSNQYKNHMKSNINL